MAQAIGIALATIVGGALIQYAPYPTHLNFWVLFAVLAILFAAAWLLPRTVSNKAPGRWQPKLPTIPRGIRMIFAASAIAATSGYVIGGLMFSLGAQIAHDLVGSDNALVNGVAIALFALAAGVVAVRRRRLGDRRHGPVGVIDRAARARDLRRRGNSGRDWLRPDVLGWPELDQCQRAWRSPWRRVIRALLGCIRDAGRRCSAARSDRHDVGTGPRRRSRRSRYCSS